MKLLALGIASVLLGIGVSADAAKSDALRTADGKPFVGIYYFTHWWEPWRSSDERVLSDFARLRKCGITTIMLDSEWSQMIDGNWKLLDRGHRLAKQGGLQILPWLSPKGWSDIANTPDRAALVKTMYGTDITLGTEPDGAPGRTKPYDPGVIEAGYRYCADYIDRYENDGALLRVMWNGKLRPVVAITVELEWSGSADVLTQQMFRLWTRAKYGDIGKLNKAWKTSFTGFEQIDMCDKSVFDLAAHCERKDKHPAAVEDHVEFRSQALDTSLAEIKRRLLAKYPDLLIATELPCEIGSKHPHGEHYRVVNGANPSSAAHADILVLRATGPIDPDVEKSILAYKRRTGQKVIITYRTYNDWGPRIRQGTVSYQDMIDWYAVPSARFADGFGYYSWNEMVDTHLVADPAASPDSVDVKDFNLAVECLRRMDESFIAAKGPK